MSDNPNFFNLTNYESKKFNMFFETRKRDVVLYGGAGSGKTYSVADKFALEVVRQDIQKDIPLKFVVIRRSLPSLKRTCIPIIKQEFSRLNIHFHLHKQDMIAEVGNKSVIYFISVNNKEDFEKVKSITDVDFIWLEEANEIPLEVYQGIIKLRLRGGKGMYAQRIFTFNPISRFIWLYDYHFVNDYDKALKIQVNIEDNIYKDPLFEKELDALKDQNLNLYKVYRLGEFGSLDGIIYPQCKKVRMIPKTADIFYGLDFGFNNPSALIQESKIDNEYYEEQLLYQTHLTNSELIEKLKDIIPVELRKKPMYCDSAEPDRIKEICNAGFNAMPADKRVMLGIDYCQRQVILMHQDSNDLIKENDTYSWRTDKDGKKIDDPVKFDDHLMDCRRYAIFTHSKTNISDVSKSAYVKETFKEYEF